MLLYHRPPEQPFIQSFPSCVADLCKMRVGFASSCQTLTAIRLAGRSQPEKSHILGFQERSLTSGQLVSSPLLLPSLPSTGHTGPRTACCLGYFAGSPVCKTFISEAEECLILTDRHYRLETTDKGILAALTFLWLHLWLWFFRC